MTVCGNGAWMVVWLFILGFLLLSFTSRLSFMETSLGRMAHTYMLCGVKMVERETLKSLHELQQSPINEYLLGYVEGQSFVLTLLAAHLNVVSLIQSAQTIAANVQTERENQQNLKTAPV